ncbi:uncharacterized protein LOC113312600 [Papaver somniferum]|uniref:uncharacterized protein LOC113312600 n=1 Tax=Papaver somniferum TaxID=3469 RepID=UPI000E701A54|nr:uncharacterized protein LOC113312600 [Papaver somniferum]
MVSDDEAPPTKTLRDRMNPSRVVRDPRVVLPATNVKFDIKPGTFSMLRKFRGIENENPYTHIRDFEMICDTMNYLNVTKDVLRLHLFSFSLEERANKWYHLIPSKTITTWDGLVEAFVKKLYPHHKTVVVRQSIQTFKQKIGESLHDYIEMFNEFLYQCPHHGFGEGHMAQILYEGLDSETRMQVETISGGEFTHQGPDVCFDEFIELAEKTRLLDSMREPEITRNLIHRVNRVDNGSDILRRLKALEMNQGSNQTMSCNSEPRTYPCTICGDQSHIGPHCPLFYPNETTRDQVSVLHGGMNSKYEGRSKFDPYSNTYNPGWRHNPNFSWSKGNHQGGPSSNPPPVITLRSGKTLENSVEPPKDSSPTEKETEVDQTSSKDPNGPENAKIPSEEATPERVYIPPAPFPQRLAKKKPSIYAEILDIFKQVKINLPLLYAIKHVPSMAKFLKEM